MLDDLAGAVSVGAETREAEKSPIARWRATSSCGRAEILFYRYSAFVVISAYVTFGAGVVMFAAAPGGWVDCIGFIAAIGCEHWLMLSYLLACGIAGGGYDDGSGFSLQWDIVFCMSLAPYVAALMVLAWRRVKSAERAVCIVHLSAASVSLTGCLWILRAQRW